jgi:UDP-N-acetyl-D-glucosamine dehydrogenase
MGAQVRVAIIGQGYVGLPVAMRAVEAGYDVVGFDVDDAKTKRLAAGESVVEDVSDTRPLPRHRRP